MDNDGTLKRMLKDSRWVPVSERLPDIKVGEWGQYIVYQKNGDGDEDDIFSFDIICILNLEHIRTADGKDALVWKTDQHELEAMPEAITHWMDLPQKPNNA